LTGHWTPEYGDDKLGEVGSTERLQLDPLNGAVLP
jgi:hypothetical protein